MLCGAESFRERWPEGRLTSAEIRACLERSEVVLVARATGVDEGNTGAVRIIVVPAALMHRRSVAVAHRQRQQTDFYLRKRRTVSPRDLLANRPLEQPQKMLPFDDTPVGSRAPMQTAWHSYRSLNRFPVPSQPP